MAKISLRSYNREIERLIDAGKIDEAIAHCRHILTLYPKHVDTYRLLGKAYLESQRYGDAADVLQRVLSAVPEDFVAHLGMSIIREDEGNLDEAIWHMERAFEMQPANAAIQNELRRLYGKRDGFEPPKIRLTRGALARMYAKGDLYQQAIAELRGGLNEDPLRLDLQSLLAAIYIKNGQRAEAASEATAVLRKLPYCLEANRVMLDVLSGPDRSGDSQTYRFRVQQLDPYAAQVNPTAPTPERVPEQAIMLDKLEYRSASAGGRGSDQPAWASSLGLSSQEFSQGGEELPDWLASEADRAASAGKAGALTAGAALFGAAAAMEQPAAEPLAEPAKEEDIPEWMKAAGWGPSSGAGEATEASGELFADEDNVADDLAQAEIPAWLQAIAPSDAPESEAAAGAPALTADEEVEADQETLAWLEAAAPPGGAEAFPWESEEATAAGAAAAVPLAAEADLDWLNASASGGENAVEVPDWLQELNNTTAGEAGSQAEQTPAAEGLAPGAAVFPAWLFAEEAKGDQESHAQEWQVEGGAGSTGAVAEAAAGAAAAAVFAGRGKEQAEAEPMPEAAVAVGLPAPVESDVPSSEMPAVEAATAEEIPVEAQQDMHSSAQAEPALEQTGVTQAEAGAGAGSQPTEQTGWEAGPNMDDEAAFAWLESLAVKQGADEALLLKPEERQDQPPAWVAEAALGAAAAGAVAYSARSKDEPEDSTAEQPPSEPAEAVPEEAVIAAASADAVPDWLHPSEEAPGVEGVEGSVPGAAALSGALETAGEDESSSAVPDWLRNLGDEPFDEEAAQAVTIPGWDQRLDALEKAEQEDALQASMEETLPSWLAHVEPASKVETGAEAEGKQVTPEELAAAMAVTMVHRVKEEPEPADASGEVQTVDEAELSASQAATILHRVQPEDEKSPQAVAAQSAAEAAETEQPIKEGLFTLEEPPIIGDTKPLRLHPVAETPPPEALEETVPSHLPTTEAAAVSAAAAMSDQGSQAVSASTAIQTGETVQTSSQAEGTQATGPGKAGMAALAAAGLAAGAAVFKGKEEAQPTAAETEREVEAAQLPVEAASSGADLAAGAILGAAAYALPEVEGSAEGTAEPAGFEEPAAETEAVPAEATPEWLLEHAEEATDQGLEGTPPAGAAAYEMDEEAAFAWLESLAVKQGADEALLLKPEERLDKPPAWVEEATIAAAAAGAVVYETHGHKQARTEEIETQVTKPAGEPAEVTPIAEATIMAAAAQGGLQEGKLEGAPMQAPQVEQKEPAASVPELPSWLSEEAPEAQEEVEWMPPQDSFRTAPAVPRPVDLNKATLGELELLPGVGFSLAQRILNYREQHGPFARLEDLQAVPGLDPATLKEIQELVFVEPPHQPPAQKETARELPPELSEAHSALVQGNLAKAIDEYEGLIKARKFLPEVIAELQDALYRFPMEPVIWQNLGDAYMRTHQIQEALDAYSKAEDLLS